MTALSKTCLCFPEGLLSCLFVPLWVAMLAVGSFFLLCRLHIRPTISENQPPAVFAVRNAVTGLILVDAHGGQYTVHMPMPITEQVH